MLNKKATMLVIIFISLLTVSSVSASETTDDVSVLNGLDDNSVFEVNGNDTEALSSNAYGSFKDLADEIANAGTTLNLNRNYVYTHDAEDYSYIQGIAIDKAITINGNGFKIDGNNKAKAFNIVSSDVTLNNINFVNCYSYDIGGAITVFESCTLNDVVFLNNTAYDSGGAIAGMGNISFNDVSFINNGADNTGGAISNMGDIFLNGAVFVNNSAKAGGAIQNDGITFINDSIFVNATACYAPAIYASSGFLIINNTKFMNLRASESAGAVACKMLDEIIIENSKFINTISTKNGGALFIDSYVDLGNYVNTLIRNVSFVNSCGDFGGAVLQLSGNLTMDDLTFLNCTSKYDGGAVYLSKVNADIDHCEFISNKATLYDDYQTFGGAIYFDCGALSINDSIFINNSAQVGSGVIYIYDSEYKIANSEFDNNGEAVYAVFKDEKSEIVDCVGEDTVSDDNVFYPYVISGVGQNLTLVDDQIDFDVLPSRFDLRDYNFTSPVMNQGLMGDCWAASFIATLESALMKKTGLNKTFSVNNLKNLMLMYSKYGQNVNAEGGSNLNSMAYLLSWMGAVPQEYDTHDELGKISPLIINNETVHIQDIIILPMDAEIIGGDPSIKQAVIRYGGLVATLSLQVNEENDFFNENTSAQYDPDLTDADHQVSIVGWDDSFSRNNFLITPPGDGAWICKNSWGEDFGEDGYFYVSYYDKTFCAFPNNTDDCAIAIVVENTVQYNRNYQYDFAGWDVSYWTEDENITYANKFNSIDDDYIAAVGTYFNQSDVNYRVEIVVNGEAVYSQEGVSPYRGYHTIKLNEYIPIAKNDEFSVYITSNIVPCSKNVRLHYKNGVSFADDGKWTDLYEEMGMVACIKVYTIEAIGPEKQNSSISAYYDILNGILTVNLANGEGDAIADADIVVAVSGSSCTGKTDDSGNAEFSTENLPAGTYKATVSYDGDDIYGPSQTTIDMLVKLNTSISAVYNNGELVASLINAGTGKGIINANVNVRIDGASYSAKTDSSGQAKLTISGLAPGIHTATVSYKGNGKYNPSSESLNISVSKITTSISIYYDEATQELVATLINSQTGQAIKGATIVFNYNGVKTATKSDKQGHARLFIGNPSADSASLSYGGNSKYFKSYASIKIVADKIPTVISNFYDESTQQVVATLINRQTGQAIKGATVVFNFNGVKTALKTDKLGQVKLSVADLIADEYYISSSYGGNFKYAGSVARISFFKI